MLVHDRPMLGGNASSEIRMHICGAHGPNNRETGIVEELHLENLYRNPDANYQIWDSVLYGTALTQENLTLLMNCTCNAAHMDGNRISSITAWQLTTETHHTVEAKLFADCSGDGILGPLTGAQFRIGREGQDEFDEAMAPELPDLKTMGLSLLIQARETPSPVPFVPPAWAHVCKDDSDLANRPHRIGESNFWWIEIGGDQDSIHDTEALRDELLKRAFGIWDHIKNHGDHGAENWALEWIGFLPGKRESRRFVGDHLLTAVDVRSEGRFEDIVAYGGWSMDDHNPAGLNHPGAPTIFHSAPSPYGIPYRCLYSKNIENLFFAGRNISATHMAMSSTRVMATCAVLGQAVGTAAALATARQTSPRGVYTHHIGELQQTLMDDDCYLPWHVRGIPALSAEASLASSSGDPEPVRNGIDRPVGDALNAWTAGAGDWIEYRFSTKKSIRSARMVFDSDLNRRGKNMRHTYWLNAPPLCPRRRW